METNLKKVDHFSVKYGIIAHRKRPASSGLSLAVEVDAEWERAGSAKDDALPHPCSLLMS